jgi:hypothetical protein
VISRTVWLDSGSNWGHQYGASPDSSEPTIHGVFQSHANALQYVLELTRKGGWNSDDYLGEVWMSQDWEDSGQKMIEIRTETLILVDDDDDDDDDDGNGDDDGNNDDEVNVDDEEEEDEDGEDD